MIQPATFLPGAFRPRQLPIGALNVLYLIKVLFMFVQKPIFENTDTVDVYCLLLKQFL